MSDEVETVVKVGGGLVGITAIVASFVTFIQTKGGCRKAHLVHNKLEDERAKLREELREERDNVVNDKFVIVNKKLDGINKELSGFIRQIRNDLYTPKVDELNDKRRTD